MPVSHAFTKRQKERLRQEKQREKEQKRKDRRTQRAEQPQGGEDPDIAGIVPGPQPLPYQDGGPDTQGSAPGGRGASGEQSS
jgi:hypothetical protein